MNYFKSQTSFFRPDFVMKACLVSILLFIFISENATAQSDKYKITKNDYSNQEVEMADAMRQNGKIYVVVTVIFIIFAGITFYIYRLDKKISALEKDIEQEGNEE